MSLIALTLNPHRFVPPAGKARKHEPLKLQHMSDAEVERIRELQRESAKAKAARTSDENSQRVLDAILSGAKTTAEISAATRLSLSPVIAHANSLAAAGKVSRCEQVLDKGGRKLVFSPPGVRQIRAQ